MSPLGVVPDRVAGPHPGVEMGKDRWRDMMILPDPLGDGPVLLPLLGEDPLNPEGLQRRHFRLQRTQTLISMEMKNRYMYVCKYYTVESYVPMYKMFE